MRYILTVEFNSNVLAVHQVLDYHNDGMPTLYYLDALPDVAGDCSSSLLHFDRIEEATELADYLHLSASQKNPRPFRIYENLEAYQRIAVDPSPFSPPLKYEF